MSTTSKYVLCPPTPVFLFLLVVCLHILTSSAGAQQEVNNVKENQWKWKKIVIVGKSAYTIYPHYYQSQTFIFDKLFQGSCRPAENGELPALSYPLPFNIYACSGDSRPENVFPPAWDISIEHLVAVSFSGFSFSLLHGSIMQIAIDDIIAFNGKFPDGVVIIDSFQRNAGVSHLDFSPIDFVPRWKSGSVFFDVRVDCKGKMELFVSWQQQFVAWEWEDKTKEWIETYAFSTADSGPFRVCQIGDELYLLFREGGIYHVNVTAAKSRGKPIVRTKIREHENPDFVGAWHWHGYDSETVREKSVHAEKISDLQAEVLVVDKDSDKAYFIAEGKLFSLTNLEKSVKLPGIAPNLKGEEADAAYLQAIMKAVRSLDNPASKPNQSVSTTNWLASGLIIAGVILAGVVIFLLLRRKK